MYKNYYNLLFFFNLPKNETIMKNKESIINEIGLLKDKLNAMERSA